MPGNALLDYVDTLASFVWRLLSAVAIVVAARILQAFVIDSYRDCEPGPARKSEMMPYYLLMVRVKAIGFFVTTIVVIGVAGFVLDEEWVRQIVSAAVVGVGFALRGFIDDMIWGFVRRSDIHIQKPIIVELSVQGDDGKVSKSLVEGQVRQMSLTTFEFHPCNSAKVYYRLPWSTLRSYQYLSKCHSRQS